ncbi:MAG: ferredoxin [Bacteroidia bacterium]|nr:ferredoxin [Bacteroidia bacterium]
MSIIKEEEIRNAALKSVAEKMLIAARTAPKARGVDNLVMAMIEGRDIENLAAKMKEIATVTGEHFFERDAGNILQSPVVLLFGTKIGSINMKKCGMCGFKDCNIKNNNSDYPCAFNSVDLGIAMGSAVSIAADNRVDCRIMYTIGQAAIDLKLLGKEVRIIYGIPLSATGKNPFFDRK